MSRPRARRERGFSLIIVFLLTMLMVGVAAAVALSTQQDLAVSGQDREAKIAFYAAEYAVALGKDYLSTQNYDKAGATGWTALLVKAPRPTELCTLVSASATEPGIVPAMVKTKYFTLPSGDEVQYQFCIHNDPDDPGYFLAAPNGESSDTGDPTHYVTIEGYGYFGKGATPLATVRIAATVGAPKTTAVSPASCYSQEGGCGQHLGNAGSLESGLKIDTTRTKGF